MNKNPGLHVASNNRGFGILEVLIAAAVMSIISLVVASMISQQNSQVSQLEDRLSRAALKNELISNFANIQRCGNNLNGVQIPATGKSSFQLMDSSGAVIFNPEVTNNRYDSLRIKDVNVVPSPNNLLNPSSRGMAMINVELERTRGTEAMKPIAVPVEVNINNNRQVTECVSAADSTPLCLDIIASSSYGNVVIPQDTRMIVLNVDYYTKKADGTFNINEFADLIYPGITKTESGRTIVAGGTLAITKRTLPDGQESHTLEYNGEAIADHILPTAVGANSSGLTVKRPFKYRSPATCETSDPVANAEVIFYGGGTKSAE